MSEPCFVPETEDDVDEAPEEVPIAQIKAAEPTNDVPIAAGEVGTSSGVDAPVEDAAVAEEDLLLSATDAVSKDFEQRFLNEKWIGRYHSTGQFVEHSDHGWKPVKEDELEFVQQLWYEQEASEIQVVDGVRLKWNSAAGQWEPDGQPDEDFIAQYQASYGVDYDYSKMDEERRALEAAKPKPPEEPSKKRKKGQPAEQQPEGWVDMEEKVNAVYVSKLPLDITEVEFKEFMSKCGVIQPDARTGKPKIKLYRDEEGDLKGDGRCCYVRKESVELALNILDGAQLKNNRVTVEKAHFELRGEYDPSKKRKKMTPAQKKAYMEKQNRLLEWKPEKPRNYRPISDCTIIIKNLFTLDMMAKNAALLLDLKEEVEQSCVKYGVVKKVVVYDNNPEGVVSVAFTTTEESDRAVQMLNGRVVDGKKLTVALWDGRTKYKVEETEEARAIRMANWEKHINQEDDEHPDDQGKEAEGHKEGEVPEADEEPTAAPVMADDE